MQQINSLHSQQLGFLDKNIHADIPTEIWGHIFYFLKKKELSKLKGISKFFLEVVKKYFDATEISLKYLGFTKHKNCISYALTRTMDAINLTDLNGEADLGILFEKFTHLRSFSLQLELDRLYSIKGLEKIQSLSQLQKLCLIRIIQDKNMPMKEIAKLSNLEVLDLDGCEVICDEGAKELANLKKLKKLNLNYSRGIRLEGFKAIAELPNLQELNLKGCYLIDATLVEIAKITSLQKLHMERFHTAIDQKRRISIKGIYALSSLINLHTLILDSHDNIKPKGWKALAQLSSLRNLSLKGCHGLLEGVTKEDLEQFVQLKLKQLNLQGLSINNDLLDLLAPMTSLQELGLTVFLNSDKEKLQNSLSQFGNLQKLVLASIWWPTPEEIEAIGKLFPSLQTTVGDSLSFS